MIRGLGMVLIACLLIIFMPLKGTAGENEALAVVFVLDNSGSMQINDSGKLRFSAAGMLTDLLRSTDRVGLVTFSSTPSVVVPLLGLDSHEQRNTIKEVLAKAKNGEDWTDLNAGLETAFLELEKAQGQGVVILVSDGEPEPGPGFRSDGAAKEKYLSKLWATAAKFTSKGWPVYSIGLSTEADIALLQKLSRETGGNMFRAPEAGALPGIFQDIFGGLRDNIPLGEFAMPLSKEQWSEPNLVRANKALKLLTFRGLSTEGQGMELQVKDPAGNLIKEGAKGVTVVKGPNYSLVSIDNPPAGNWLVQARGGGTGRVNVEAQSQYTLQVLEPTVRGVLPVESSVRFRVKATENALPVISPELKLRLESEGQEILALNLDQLEAGIFSGVADNLLKLNGPKKFRLSLADGTGEILGKELFYYGKDMPYLLLQHPIKGWLGETSPIEGTVMYKNNPLTGGGFEVRARITGPNSTWEGELKEAGSAYLAQFTPTASGSYNLSLKLNGEFQGEKINYETGGIPLNVGVRPNIKLNVQPEMYVGRKGVLEVQVESQAPSTEQVLIGGTVNRSDIPPQTLQLAPGEKKTVYLEVPWESTEEKVTGKIKLSGPNLKGQEQEVIVHFLTPLEDFWYSYRLSLSIGIFLLVALCVFFGLGNLLYRYFARKLILKGMLVVGQGSQLASPRRLVPLQAFNKDRVFLGWGEDADIMLDKVRQPEQGGYTLLIEAKLEEHGSSFLTGWAFLFGKRRIMIIVSSPGSSFRFKEKRAKWPATKTKAILRDGDEINFHGSRILYRK